MASSAGPQEVADEQPATRYPDPNDLGEHRRRLQDVMDDAVGDDGAEGTVWIGQVLGVLPLQTDALAKAGALHIAPAQVEHGVGEVDGDEGDGRMPTAGSSMGIWAVPVPTIENRAAPVPAGEEVLGRKAPRLTPAWSMASYARASSAVSITSGSRVRGSMRQPQTPT